METERTLSGDKIVNDMPKSILFHLRKREKNRRMGQERKILIDVVIRKDEDSGKKGRALCTEQTHSL